MPNIETKYLIFYYDYYFILYYNLYNFINLLL